MARRGDRGPRRPEHPPGPSCMCRHMNAVKHNKALIHRLVEIVNERQLDRIDEVASGPVAREAARWIGPFARSFPDFRMEVVEVIAEIDKVVGYFKCAGTQAEAWRGNPSSGRRFENVDEIYIFRVEAGKLHSVIAVVEDNLTRLTQLGLTP